MLGGRRGGRFFAIVVVDLSLCVDQLGTRRVLSFSPDQCRGSKVLIERESHIETVSSFLFDPRQTTHR
jgi:hypothetical protein